MEGYILAVIELIGIIATALITKNQFVSQLDKKISVVETQMKSLSQRVDSHNRLLDKYTQLQSDIALISKDIQYIRQTQEKLEKRLDK